MNAKNNAAGCLTTHVLDTTTGRPAAGIGIDLFRIDGGDREFLVSTRTNQDGRCDSPLLEGVDFRAGVYELVFHVGAYFAGTDPSPAPRFLDEVPIRVGLADPDARYHVPLLVSPFSYSTYRGS